jgi:hypothetical protein
MKLVAAALAVLGLAYVGLALAEEHGERGLVVALLVLLVGVGIAWSNPNLNDAVVDQSIPTPFPIYYSAAARLADAITNFDSISQLRLYV